MIVSVKILPDDKFFFSTSPYLIYVYYVSKSQVLHTSLNALYSNGF